MKAAVKMLRVMMELWIPHGPSFFCLTFNSEVGYGWPVLSVMEEQWAMYGAWLWFALVKGSQ